MTTNTLTDDQHKRLETSYANDDHRLTVKLSQAKLNGATPAEIKAIEEEHADLKAKQAEFLGTKPAHEVKGTEVDKTTGDTIVDYTDGTKEDVGHTAAPAPAPAPAPHI